MTSAKKEAIKKAVAKRKQASKAQVSKVKIEKKQSVQRDAVEYTINKDFSVDCVFTSYQNKEYKEKITKAHSIALSKIAHDRQKFYSYINNELKLLSKLHCDSEAKKNQLCKNTQYDSRKKLQQMYLQLALSSASNKVKASKKAKAISKAKKAKLIKVK